MSVDLLKQQILSSANDEKRVEVNQRHLIDKILARYAAKFVVFRELMQNSDDAKSSIVQISYETANPNRDNKLKDKVNRILFRNNGFPFRPEDWDRLKKIAEGNPDEQKIGAFGVGFYSLFSVCEDPYVLSGDQGMAFYWCGNQLMTKHSPINNEDNNMTTFVMDLREPEEFPDIEEFSRFLTNSLGFTENLKNVYVCFNNNPVIQLSKEIGSPKLLTIPADFDTYSPRQLFHLISVNIRNVHLNIKKLHIPINARHLPITNVQVDDASISLKIVSGNLDVKIPKEMISEMERTTKKKPPNKTTIQMIYTGYDDYVSSLNYDDGVSSTFVDLVPFPYQGKIYIGFPTQQTTGCCSHLAARLIPTVERELVDLADKTLVKYNSDLLSLAGTICRILYEDEMTYIGQLFTEMITSTSANSNELKTFREWFEKRVSHALTHFTFGTSTPNKEISLISESQFFKCSKKQLSVLSTNGILPISSVRIPNKEMEGFIKTVSIIPKIIFEDCPSFFIKAKDKKLIEELTLKDVLSELKSRTLSEEEMVELLKWWISYRTKGNVVSPSDLAQFMQLAHIERSSRPLSMIRYILNPGIVPPHMDVPNEVLPYNISKRLKNNQDLTKWFKWTELSLTDWAKFIVNKPDLEKNLGFARKVHNVLAKSLNNLSDKDKEVIRQLFAQKRCIPTKFGMNYPQESYLHYVNLFRDLPNIDFKKPSGVQNIMELLGVRKVVELQLIFSRLVSNGDWDHIRLVKYLASKKSDLNEGEMKLLKAKPLWPRGNKANSRANGMNQKRYVAKDLYSPVGIHREFGLPVIDWKGRWFCYSTEAQFLIELGLRDYPTLEKILELMAPTTHDRIRNKAFRYFIDNFKEKYDKEYKPDRINIAFLPCIGTNTLAKPTECFVNSECMTMGFKAIRHDLLFYATQFGVRHNPSHDRLLKRLIDNPLKDEYNAREIFEYLASQQGEFTPSDWKVLNDLEFIPTRNRNGALIFAGPRNCFFKKRRNENSLNNFFTYIDFGEKANRFLQCCGVKDEPSTVEIAELLLRSSHDLWNSMSDNAEKYLDNLKRIALEYDTISKKPGLVSEMSRKPILMALQKGKGSTRIKSYSLASAREIYINDNPIYQKAFDALIAPEEDSIENLYKKLGCRSLRESVKETAIPKGVVRKNVKTKIWRQLIKTRIGLFYHEQPPDMIMNDHKWLEKLKVREIDNIELSFTLNGRIEKGTTTACILKNVQLGRWVLYITPEPKSIHVSQYIVKNIFKSFRLKDMTCCNTILITESQGLEDMGYPVDRIMKPKIGSVVNRYSQTTVKKPVVANPQMIQNLRNSLRDAIKTCHSNLGSAINSQTSVTIGESQTSYCDVIPGQSLHCVGTKQDIELYDSNSIGKAEILSPSNTVPLNRFINMLKNIASVFDLPSQAIHIFYDDYSNSIAFNRDRALFFNLKFYIGFHDKDCKNKPTCNAMTYWFMTICHELAHNLVQSHSSEHEYYLSSFAETYMSNFLAMLKKHQIS